jgi:glycosyltransferase involved in cell wall biosynthesis
MYNLQKHLDKNEFTYTGILKDVSAIFFPIQYNIGILKKIKNDGGKIIQRLDGVYYPEKHGISYKFKNRKIKNIYINYSNFIVFQSEYSKRQCFDMFGKKDKNDFTVIVNGADQSIFYPSKKKTLGKRIVFITTGNFRNVDMLEPIILALDKIKRKYDFELRVVGPVTHKKLKGYLDREYINYIGEVSIVNVANHLRKSDTFLYSHLNPPCPNSVIEAISCGLPVVGFNSGAMEELLTFSKDLLAEVSDDLFQKYEDFKSANLADKIELAINMFSLYKRNAVTYSGRYSFEDCGRKYVEVFKRVLSN